jgi:3-dehydroquinate dehydratase II
VRVAVVHGPNLNLVGRREAGIYGTVRLPEIDAALRLLAQQLGASVECFQSNGEGAIVDHIQASGEAVDGFVINAGAYTHTSVAIRDALIALGRPYVEVHLSNLFAREGFRRRSLLADRAIGMICGFGAGSYLLGLRGLVEYLRRTSGSAGDLEDSAAGMPATARGIDLGAGG